MQVVSEQRAVQRLSRNRQRIPSRICTLKVKFAFPQYLSHSRNLRVILRERILKCENALVHVSVVFYTALLEKILLHI